MLKKFDFEDLSPMPTPMSTSMVLDEDTEGVAMDQKEYRSMIGSLLYLTARSVSTRGSRLLRALLIGTL